MGITILLLRMLIKYYWYKLLNKLHLMFGETGLGRVGTLRGVESAWNRNYEVEKG